MTAKIYLLKKEKISISSYIPCLMAINNLYLPMKIQDLYLLGWKLLHILMITSYLYEDYFKSWWRSLQILMKITSNLDKDYFKSWWRLLQILMKITSYLDEDYFISWWRLLHIQRLRQRSPPIIPTKGGAACVCLYKRRGMADFHHHFLDGYRYCSSTKPRLRIDLGTKKGLPFTACRNSIWFDFYDCSKNA